MPWIPRGRREDTDMSTARRGYAAPVPRDRTRTREARELSRARRAARVAATPRPVDLPALARELGAVMVGGER